MSRVRCLGPVLLLASLLGGCAVGAREATAPTLLPAGRVLVVGRILTEENRAVVEAAEDLVVRRLRSAGDVQGASRFLQAAAAGGAWGPAFRLVEGLRHGLSPVAEAVAPALEELGLRGVVVVDVPTYEQVWGRYAKFTRVAVEAEAFQLSPPGSAWRVRGFVETEGRRGRAFELTLEEAVRILTDDIAPGAEPPFLAELWRAWRR
jgi:hypothetical protein